MSMLLNFFAASALKGSRTYMLLGLGAAMVALNAAFPGVHDGLGAVGVQLDPANWLADFLKIGVGVTMRSGIGHR